MLDVSNQSTRTINGVTLTVNGDGTFTLNGTATANTTFSISSGIILKAGTYTASGVSGGSSSTYYYGILQNNSWVFRNYNGSDTFTISSDTTYSTILIVVGNGTTVSNVTISPMIQKGSTATTYEPYVTPSINVNGEEIYSKPVVLFNNANGLFDDITLTDSKSNYSKLEIYFIDDQDFQNSMAIDASNNPFQLQFVKSGTSRGYMYFIATRFSYSGNTIKRGTTTIYNLINGVITENTTADVLKITKIIGYKY